ncbi:MFS transporter [Alkalicoccobacillus gibsonii]|uniref:MFS transporter n=1 Tax=Alkalicoccobacillus gibsonii TaxID=79881 RepID=UPI003F7CBEE1
MKTLFQTLKKYPSARAFCIFSILFYLSMYVSKTVHALWFDEQGALPYFGFSYTMMAIAGSLAFITGRIGDILSPSFALRLGVLVYSIGLILRVFTQSLFIAGLSGFIAGLGASLVVVSMRYWILSIGDSDDRSAIVSLKETSVNSGTAIGASIAGLLVAFFAYLLDQPLVAVLVIAAILCALTIFFIPKLNKDENSSSEDGNKKNTVSKMLYVGVILFGILGGLSVSLLIPFYPIILKEQGVPISLIGVFIAIMGISAIFFGPIFSHKSVNQKKGKIFFWCELIAAATVLLFMFDLAIYLIPLILVARTFFQTGSIISQELMELHMYPKAVIGMLFGLSQSSFFVGDALGGSIGGFLFNISQNYALIACASLLFVNACIFPLFYKHIIKANTGVKNEAVS